MHRPQKITCQHGNHQVADETSSSQRIFACTNCVFSPVQTAYFRLYKLRIFACTNCVFSPIQTAHMRLPMSAIHVSLHDPTLNCSFLLIENVPTESRLLMVGSALGWGGWEALGLSLVSSDCQYHTIASLHNFRPQRQVLTSYK